MQPKLNILAAFFVIKARGEGYTGHTSACGLLMLLTTAFTAWAQPNGGAESTALNNPGSIMFPFQGCLGKV